MIVRMNNEDKIARDAASPGYYAPSGLGERKALKGRNT